MLPHFYIDIIYKQWFIGQFILNTSKMAPQVLEMAMNGKVQNGTTSEEAYFLLHYQF